MSTFTRILAKAATTSALLVVVLSATGGCEQSAPKCSTGRGTFIARYISVGGPPDCAKLTGEKLGLQSYNGKGELNRPDLDANSMAIQAESVGLLVDNAEAAGKTDPDAAHKPFSYGGFTTAEPEGDFCAVPTLSAAVQNLPEIAEDEANEISAQPATTISYEWQNIRVYVTPAAYGTQFTGDLKRTENGLTCDYKVVGMYPYVDCSAPDPADADKSIPDEGACAPEANIEAGRPTGSGISPDFPTRCDPVLLACVLTQDTIPALK